MFSKFSVATFITLFIAAFLIFGCETPKEEVQSQPAKQAEKTMADKKAVAQKATENKGLLEVVGGTEYEFGEINRGEKVVHTFVLKNVGKDVIHIKRAKGS